MKEMSESVLIVTEDGMYRDENALVPVHVAIIMDGSGRWAESRGFSRKQGHRNGVGIIRPVLRSFAAHGVKYLTLFAFSTENWERPPDEVEALMELLGKSLSDETGPLHEEGVRIKHLGRIDELTPELRKSIQDSVELTKDNAVMTLSVAFNYGGRAELVDAVRGIVSSGLEPDQITEDVIESYLYTQGIPDPDLVIRTGGEMRLSNFLLWQTSYSEYYSTPTLWPDFDESHVDEALGAYQKRQRRYGRSVPGKA